MNKFAIFLLGVLVGTICGELIPPNDAQPQYVYETKKDSVTEYKIVRDTTFVERPKVYKEIIRDTIQLNSLLDNGSKHLVVSQKEYRDSNYVAWVSGIEPQLDSIMVFNNTEYVFKTATIETIKTVEDRKGKLFVGAGLYRLGETFVPKTNIAYKKKSIMVGASIGLYNNQPIYGVDINFKVK